MVDWETERDVMSKPFNITTHKNTFTHYLEVIIDEEGTIHYAVPSHLEWLIQKACEKLNMNRNELMNNVPREYYFDMLTWLTKVTDCIAVWDTSYVGTLNYAQRSQLELLMLEGLYEGAIVNT